MPRSWGEHRLNTSEDPQDAREAASQGVAGGEVGDLDQRQSCRALWAPGRGLDFMPGQRKASAGFKQEVTLSYLL